MGVVKKTMKTGLYVFGFFVFLLVVGAIYLYTNLDSIAKEITESVASETLGVPVSIGKMEISLDNLKVVISDLKVSNPNGYKNPNAITVKKIEIDGDSFNTDLLVFSHVSVDGTNVNLEVGNSGTNLSDIQSNINNKPVKASSKGENIKVVVKKFSLTNAKLNPFVTLLGGDLGSVNVPNIRLNGIGQKENGILAREAISQIMLAILDKFNKSANSAGFLEGMSLEALNAIGVSTVEVFKKNLKNSYEKEVDSLKKGLKGLRGLFE